MEKLEREIVRGGQWQDILKYISVLQIGLFRSVFVKSMTSTVMNMTLKVGRPAGGGAISSDFSCEFKQYFETLRAKL